MAIRLAGNIAEANAITHAGKFHADDIFSMVLLERVYSNSLFVYRAENFGEIKDNIPKNSIVFDIGFGEFDHHQVSGNGTHPCPYENLKAIPYASFGLLWRKYGEDFCKNYTTSYKDLFNYVEKKLAIGIDAIDNGLSSVMPESYDYYKTFNLSNLINTCNPIGEDEDYESAIYNALNFARFIFDSTIKMGLVELQPCQKHPTKINADKLFYRVLLDEIFPNRGTNFQVKTTPVKFHDLGEFGLFYNKKPVPLGKVGKLWYTYGKEYCRSLYYDETIPDYVWQSLDTYLIAGLDASSCGINSLSPAEYMPYNILSLSNFIKRLSIIIDENNYSYYYENAYNMAKTAVCRLIKKGLYKIKSRQYIAQKMKEAPKSPILQHILVLDRHSYWKEWIDKRQFWFVISPSSRLGFDIYPVRSASKTYRKCFPKSWYGCFNEDLVKVTGVPGALFVHPQGFIGGARDLKSAIDLIRLALKDPVNNSSNKSKDE